MQYETSLHESFNPSKSLFLLRYWPCPQSRERESHSFRRQFVNSFPTLSQTTLVENSSSSPTAHQSRSLYPVWTAFNFYITSYTKFGPKILSNEAAQLAVRYCLRCKWFRNLCSASRRFQYRYHLWIYLETECTGLCGTGDDKTCFSGWSESYVKYSQFK